MGAKITHAIVIVSLLAVLSGCALFGQRVVAPAPVADPKVVWCNTNSPERPSVAEIELMTTERVKNVLAHNEKGKAWCGWTA